MDEEDIAMDVESNARGSVFRRSRFAWWTTLCFVDPALEEEFRSYDRIQARRKNVQFSLVAMALEAAFIPVDFLTWPQPIALRILPWRLAITAMVCMYALAMKVPFLERRSSALWGFCAVLFSLGIYPIAMANHLEGDAPGVPIVVMNASAMMVTIRHVHFLFSAAAITACYAVWQLLLPTVPLSHALLSSLYLPAALVTSAIASYSLESQRRQAFFALKSLGGEIAELEREEAINESLLRNVLPSDVLEKLNSAGGVRESIVEAFDGVTCVFMDVTGLEEYCGTDNANVLVDTLNDIFCEFDGILDRYGVEKVKSNSSVYMAVAGCPQPHPRSAFNIISFAIECRKIVSNFNKMHKSQLAIKVGANTGKVVAGVVGKHRYVWDVWGDAVNLASRLETNCVNGDIQVSSSTKKLLEDDFEFRDRGSVLMKGKGLVRVFVLVEEGELDMLAADFPRSQQKVSLLTKLAKNKAGRLKPLSSRLSHRLSARSHASTTDVVSEEDTSSARRDNSTSRGLFSTRGEHEVVMEEEEEAKATQGTMAALDEQDKPMKWTLRFPKAEMEQCYQAEKANANGTANTRIVIVLCCLVLFYLALLDVLFAFYHRPDFHRSAVALIVPMLFTSGLCLVAFLTIVRPPSRGAVYAAEDSSFAARLKLVRLYRRTGVMVAVAMGLAVSVRLYGAPRAAQFYNNAIATIIIALLNAINWVSHPVVFFIGCALVTPLVASAFLLGNEATLLVEKFATDNGLLLANLVILYLSTKNNEKIQRIAFSLRQAALEKREKAAQSKKVSDELLLNILPASVAVELRQGSMSMAHDFSEGSLLVSDIKGFTAWSATKEPRDLVAFIDTLFHKLDDLCIKWQCEKIKTLGDCYVAAAGLHSDRKGSAQRLCHFGLEMHAVVAEVCEEMHESVQMRVGVHSGPFLAGVIGTRKFAWDLWGPSVAGAFKAEEDGTAGRVHITPETYERVKDEFLVDRIDHRDGTTSYLLQDKEQTGSTS